MPDLLKAAARLLNKIQDAIGSKVYFPLREDRSTRLIYVSPLQFNNNPVALAEWFVSSIILVLVVTLIYLVVLRRAPPPEGITMTKLDQGLLGPQNALNVHQTVAQAESMLAAGNYSLAVETSARAVGAILQSILRGRQSGSSDENLGIADEAYIVQTKAAASPEIVQPVYHLNNLRLQALRGQSVSPQDSQWAVAFARWLLQATDANQIRMQ